MMLEDVRASQPGNPSEHMEQRARHVKQARGHHGRDPAKLTKSLDTTRGLVHLRGQGLV